MKTTKSISLSKLENYFVTVGSKAQNFNLSFEETTEYFLEEMKKQFNMPELNFKLHSLCKIEALLKNKLSALNWLREEIAYIYGVIFGQAVVSSLGGIWTTDIYKDEPEVCFEGKEFKTINPVEIAREFILEGYISPALVYYRMVLDRIKRRIYHVKKESVIPNYKLFVKLPLKLQWEMIISVCSENEIAVRQTHTHTVSLIQIRDFYVEIFVNLETCEDERYNLFQSTSRFLNPYLRYINLAELTG